MCRYFIVIDDIWDILVWSVISFALPDDNDGYRILTTTRISDVAEQVGGPYKLKPLSLRNSRILFCTRIFGNECKGKCPNEQLTSVSERILKKCAGVPLAIITIASLLASKGRNKIEWFKVFNSIGTGLENSLDLENMRKILSLSYYDLPSHLRTCLLYLSAFPEDYHIEKSRLIWLWMAEGFIQSSMPGNILFDTGESYFYELMNRGMIRPVYKWYDSKTEYCCVLHDMVLDLICSLSCEENFVTILNNVDSTSTSRKVRRLSLQNSKVDHATRSMAQVRSVVVFPSAIDLTLFLPSFTVLRVLDIQDCLISQGCSLKYLGNLLQLRYLGLKHTSIATLPEEIGNLQFLQTLDITRNIITSLPSTIIQLKHLMCLRIDVGTVVPTGIGRLTSLEVLEMVCIGNSTDTIEDLGLLTELRSMGIVCDTKWNKSLDKSLVKSLNKLQRIRSLYINLSGECYLDAWVAPLHLYEFDAEPRLMRSWFSRLPAWLNPSVLLDLSSLSIAVNELQQEDLGILGRLPALRKLDMVVRIQNYETQASLVVGAHSFPCLVQFLLQGRSIQPLVFQQGAMPRLARLYFPQCSREEVRKATDSNSSFHLDLRNLPSLQNVTIDLQCYCSTSELQEVKAALRHLTEIHPNHPTFEILYT
jgi:Leucine-rich repeat (LRR) protein